MLEDRFDLRSIVKLLQRRVKLIISVFLLVVSLTAVYVFSLAPKYTAFALIEISPVTTNVLAPTKFSENFSINNVRVEGEIEILASDAVALRVVDGAALLHDAEFGVDTLNADKTAQYLLTRTIRNFQQASEVSRKNQTYLVTAQVSSTSPVRAAELANIWVESYLDHQVAVKVEALKTVEQILSQRLLSAQAALEMSETAIDTYIIENMQAISMFTGRQDIAQLGKLFSETTQTQQRIIELKNILIQEKEIENWDAINSRLESEALNSLTSQYVDLTENLDSASDLNEIETREQLDSLVRQLNSEATSQIQNLQTSAQMLIRQTDQQKRQFRSLVLAADLPVDIVANIYALQQEATIARSEYDAILERRRAVALQIDLQIADSRLISPALPPLTQSIKGKANTMLAATGIGIFAGFMMAFLAEYSVGGFVSERQLAQDLSLRVATRIPAIAFSKGRKKSDATLAQAFLANPMSHYAESIRRLRVALDQALLRQQKPSSSAKIVMVTSSVPGEGKSNTSLALGRAYAQSGKRVLLVDCDFRNPKIHNLLSSNAQNPLFKAIAEGRKQGDSCPEIPITDDTQLQLMAGSTAGLLLNDQTFEHPVFLKFLEDCQSKFDFIILDTPPLLPIVDSAHLAKMADVIALTVKWASTSQSDVRAALDILKDSKSEHAEIVAILSQENAPMAHDFDKYSAYFSG